MIISKCSFTGGWWEDSGIEFKDMMSSVKVEDNIISTTEAVEKESEVSQISEDTESLILLFVFSSKELLLG